MYTEQQLQPLCDALRGLADALAALGSTVPDTVEHITLEGGVEGQELPPMPQVEAPAAPIPDLTPGEVNQQLAQIANRLPDGVTKIRAILAQQGIQSLSQATPAQLITILSAATQLECQA